MELYKLVDERDKELSETFDDFRRSTAKLLAAVMHAKGLWTDEEIAEFGPETRGYLDEIAHLRNCHR